jgi:hypothetical protein
MNFGLRCNAAFPLAAILVLGYCAWSFADDAEPPGQLTLADLPAYRAALSGKATDGDSRASDPPARVSFNDLWNRPAAFRGRRVIIQGRVERIFRQGPVGSFPALAEVWIASPTGNPFCLVVPQESGAGSLRVNNHALEGRAKSPAVLQLGQTVRFTGTFLKMVRYTAGDGARLAPLVVGDQPPVPVQNAAKLDGAGSPYKDHGVSSGGHPDNRGGRWSISLSSWALGLILVPLAAGVLAWQHLRAPLRRIGVFSQGRSTAAADPDCSLEFIEPGDESCRSATA